MRLPLCATLLATTVIIAASTVFAAPAIAVPQKATQIACPGPGTVVACQQIRLRKGTLRLGNLTLHIPDGALTATTPLYGDSRYPPGCDASPNNWLDVGEPNITANTHRFPVGKWGITSAELTPEPTRPIDAWVSSPYESRNGCESWFTPTTATKIARTTALYLESWRIHLYGPTLGPNCYIGSGTVPLYLFSTHNSLDLELKPVSVSSVRTNGDLTTVSGQRLIDKDVSPPRAVLCGPIDHAFNVLTGAVNNVPARADFTIDQTIIRR
ncbi:hypothetical protein [Gordonia sp. CPCC 205333]|uniref:hypothetical protein n=1 Tax=Gordonia sp. CPCC 205333 TaxID=3140790 RepID=UPI003AF3AF9A